MTANKAKQIIENEKECVLRSETCDRACGKCDLVMDSEEIINAYDKAILLLQRESYFEFLRGVEQG